MDQPKILRFYLHEQLRRRALAGDHNFIRKIAKIAENAQFRVEYLSDTPKERQKASSLEGYFMFHMDDPIYDRSLTFRRVYHFPFWAIESHAKRWEWRVAQTGFPADEVQRAEADTFYQFWQKRLFGDAPQSTDREGFVYVPLQGKLLSHRSFQHCSPIDMVKHVLTHDPDRRVIATLHPKEDYSQAEMDALTTLARKNPRLTVKTGDMVRMLQGCDYVVSQNSSAAFDGYFFGKPAILFGHIDFHHIAANTHDLGISQAFAQVLHMKPDYAGYLHWFWQTMSINAGRPEADEKIRQSLINAGWPM